MNSSFFPIRKFVTCSSDVLREADRQVAPPQRQIAIGAVLRNDYAGQFVEDLAPLARRGGEIAALLAPRAIAILQAMAGEQIKIEAYGKAAIIGVSGEMEHGAALMHPLFGREIRAALPNASEIMPSSHKRAAAGADIDVPLHSISDMWSFDHFDAVNLSVTDAPAPNEIIVLLALATTGRPLGRVEKA